ncbi:N-acetylmuramoyl-L-alanine amidase [Priestia megaterium]
MKKIYRDAGHGLPKDPGAVGNGLKECEVVLTIQQLFDAYLLANYEGFELKATREDNKTFLELGERARRANQWNADVFISFHINSASSSATGYEDFVYTHASSASKSLQNMVHEQVLPVLRKHNVTNRGKKTANYAVLRMTNMPAILTETLFISNPKDAQNLKSIEFLKDFASAYAEGVAKFLGLKAKSDTPSPVQTPKEEIPNAIKTPTKETAIGTVKVLVDDLWYYNKKDWNAKVGKAKKGDVFTVVSKIKVNSAYMYQLISGTYITAATKYVKFTKK